MDCNGDFVLSFDDRAGYFDSFRIDNGDDEHDLFIDGIGFISPPHDDYYMPTENMTNLAIQQDIRDAQAP
jgi:hypothetical protein